MRWLRWRHVVPMAVGMLAPWVFPFGRPLLAFYAGWLLGVLATYPGLERRVFGRGSR